MRRWPLLINAPTAADAAPLCLSVCRSLTSSDDDDIVRLSVGGERSRQRHARHLCEAKQTHGDDNEQRAAKGSEREEKGKKEAASQTASQPPCTRRPRIRRPTDRSIEEAEAEVKAVRADCCSTAIGCCGTQMTV